MSEVKEKSLEYLVRLDASQAQNCASTWKQERIDSICELGRGRVISQEEIEQNAGIYPVYSSQSKNNGVFGYLDKYDFDGDYVTWTTDGAHAGTVFYRSGKFNCTNVCGTLKAKSSEASHSFIARALSLVAKNHVSYIGNPKLMNNVMAGISIPFPPSSEQHAIAAVLDTLDAAIEKSEALIAKLKQVRAGMLHDLLTCGVDENGEIRDPEIYPHYFKNSPLGLIPINWKLTNLVNLSEFITSGCRGWASFYSDQGSMFIRIGNLTREHINLRFDDVQYVKPPRSAEGQRTKVEGNDLLISITADIGIIGMIPPDFGEAYVNQHIALIRLKPSTSSSRWIGHLLSSHRYQKIFQSLNDSGAKAGLNLSTLASLPIALPQSEVEQQRIVETLDALDEDIATQINALEKLRQTKLGLSSDLLTGQTRIPPNLELP